MKYKSLLLDVDGTIVPVGPNMKPSEAVSYALKRAKEKVHVSLVSGRCLGWLEELFENLDLKAPCIINGGSQIIDPVTKEIIWERQTEKSLPDSESERRPVSQKSYFSNCFCHLILGAGGADFSQQGWHGLVSRIDVGPMISQDECGPGRSGRCRRGGWRQ